MKLILFAIAAIMMAYCVASNEVRPGEVSEFHAWTVKYNKTYQGTAEFWLRFNNYQASKQRMVKLQQSNPRAKFAPNKFSDLSAEEFKRLYLTARPPAVGAADPIEVAPAPLPGAVPKTFDWRDKNAVTYVKDQGQCGSCWAFSVTENIESMWFLAGHKLVDLSPQQIVDCDTVDSGCDGGWPYNAYNYVVGAPGLETDDAYPYYSGSSGSAGTCAYNKKDVAANITGFKYAVPACQDSCSNQNETLLIQQLVANGPLSVCVDAESWQDYDSGILSDCPSDYNDLDHCVQLVGYDLDNEFYIVRNSWNTDWGQEGYIYLQTGQNTCGIADLSTFATAKKFF